MVPAMDTSPARGLAILLLASTVINYVISSRTTALFNTRREIAREMAVLDQLVRAQRPEWPPSSGVLEQVVKESSGIWHGRRFSIVKAR